MLSSVAIVVGPHLAFLDHLIPLCDLFGMPLFAPHLSEHLLYPSVALASSLEGFDSFFYAEPARLHRGAFQFGSLLVQEEKRSVCTLHGNSNKCRNSFWAERFAQEEIVLVYGHYMESFLREKGVWESIRRPIFCGNYRWHYFQKHRTQFSCVLPGEGKKILYAPTWSYVDATDDSPFFSCYTRLFDQIPEGFTLFVKLHPYMYKLHPQRISAIKEHYRDTPRLFFLDDTPLVYPILEQIDIYIGDYSSIAYDFLAFDRPLFFLADNVDPLMERCGQQIVAGNIFAQLDQEGDSAARQELYRDCFADVSMEELRSAVCAALTQSAYGEGHAH